MLEHRVLGEDNLTHRTAEGCAARADVVLHNRCPAAGAGDDQGARRAEGRSPLGAVGKEELDGLGDDDILRQVDERAVRQQGGVEGRKWVVFEWGETPEVVLDEL